MPQNQPLSINDVKEHYESLVKLFKYCVTGLITLTVLVGGVIGFFTWQNGAEMRAALKDERAEMHSDIKEMKDELKTLKEEAKQSIDDTKNESLKKIENISSKASENATFEAKKKISEIFEGKGVKQFVEDVVQKKIEPVVEKLIDKQIAFNLEKRIDGYISNIQSSDRVTQSAGFEGLQQSVHLQWAPRQISKIIELIEGNIFNADIKGVLCDFLIFKKSDEVTSFFEGELLKDNPYTRPRAITYLTDPDMEQNVELYLRFIGSDQSKLRAVVEISTSQNPALIVRLLNSQVLVETFNNSLHGDELRNFKHIIKSTIERGINNDLFKDVLQKISNSLFFQTMK